MTAVVVVALTVVVFGRMAAGSFRALVIASAVIIGAGAASFLSVTVWLAAHPEHTTTTVVGADQ